jgi:hypothetical protein
MTVFSIDKLMQETRRLAAEYRQSTGQTLPISGELARYDAARLLKLLPLDKPLKSVDFMGSEGPLANQLIQIKSRVIFDKEKTGYRIGQLDVGANWQICALVLYQANYEPTAIYIATQAMIVETLSKRPTTAKARGLMSLAQFKRLANLIWTPENGLEWDSLWSNAS